MKEEPFLPAKLFHRVRSAGSRVYYGWWILLLGSLIQGIGGGVMYHSFTVFFLPLKRDLGASSAAVSLLYGSARLEGGIDGALYGYLIDRFGSRKMIMIGASLAGIGLILLSTVHSFLSFFLIYVFVVSVGSNAARGSLRSSLMLPTIRASRQTGHAPRPSAAWGPWRFRA